MPLRLGQPHVAIASTKVLWQLLKAVEEAVRVVVNGDRVAGVLSSWSVVVVVALEEAVVGVQHFEDQQQPLLVSSPLLQLLVQSDLALQLLVHRALGLGQRLRLQHRQHGLHDLLLWRRLRTQRLLCNVVLLRNPELAAPDAGDVVVGDQRRGQEREHVARMLCDVVQLPLVPCEQRELLLRHAWGLGHICRVRVIEIEGLNDEVNEESRN